MRAVGHAEQRDDDMAGVTSMRGHAQSGGSDPPGGCVFAYDSGIIATQLLDEGATTTPAPRDSARPDKHQALTGLWLVASVVVVAILVAAAVLVVAVVLVAALRARVLAVPLLPAFPATAAAVPVVLVGLVARVSLLVLVLLARRSGSRAARRARLRVSGTRSLPGRRPRGLGGDRASRSDGFGGRGRVGARDLAGRAREGKEAGQQRTKEREEKRGRPTEGTRAHQVVWGPRGSLIEESPKQTIQKEAILTNNDEF